METNIIEGNELLAQLLGWEKEIEGVEGVWYENVDYARYVAYSINSNYPHKDLPFHRDMNWLFKVVDKIETINNGWDGRRGNGTVPLRVFNEKDNAIPSLFKSYIISNQHPCYISTAPTRLISIWNTCVCFTRDYLNDSE